MRILFCHIVDPDNIGDLASCPRNYLDFRSDIEVDTFNIFDEQTPPVADVMIFGGGGMLHQNIDAKMHDLRIWMLTRNPKCKFIIWGIGSNYHFQKYGYWPEWLKLFDLVGLRDVMWDCASGWHVPCCSCRHPLFSQPHGKAEHELVGYWQAHLPAPKCNFPYLTNYGPIDRMPEILSHLASGETVITNSFHGAYWACLLQRKAVIHNPFSSRFHQGLKSVSTRSIGLSSGPNIDESIKMASSLTQCPASYAWTCSNHNKLFLGHILNLIGKDLIRWKYE